MWIRLDTANETMWLNVNNLTSVKLSHDYEKYSAVLAGGSILYLTNKDAEQIINLLKIYTS